MQLQIFTTGGTIDKVYFDQLSEFKVGDSTVAETFREAGVVFEYAIESLMKKDSLELTDADRETIYSKVAACACSRIIITHGTDTMTLTAERLAAIPAKTIVLTGAMQPARLRATDAIFNIGFAAAAVQAFPAGIYIAMNGQVFAAAKVRKNRGLGRFEALE